MRSPNYMRLIVEGKRNLTTEHIEPVVSACKLSEDEAKYFATLVHFNQAKDAVEREMYWKELLRVSPKEGVNRLRHEDMTVLQRWYILVLKELLSLRDFELTPAWFGARFSHGIPYSEIEEGYRFLESKGFIKREKGRPVASGKAVFSEGKGFSELVKEFHNQMLDIAKKMLFKTKPAYREYLDTILSVRLKDLPELKKELQRVQEKFLSYAAKVDDADQVYELSIQLYPLTELNSADPGSQ